MLREVQSFINFSVIRTILTPILSGASIMILLIMSNSFFQSFSFIIALIISPIILYYSVGITKEDKNYALKAIS